MKIEQKIFKAYDIRGIYGEQFDETTAELVGRALVALTGARRFAVGRDMRPSSPGLAQAMISGMLAAGADVVYIGQVSTPMLSFAVARDESIEAGVMVTASHNPAEYNGFKMMRGDMSPICKGAGMEELFELVAAQNVADADQAGSLTYDDVFDAYKARLFELVEVSAIKDLQVALDAGNGVNGPVIHEILNDIEQVTAHELYFEPDGTFPNHEANPLDHETLDDLRARVATTNADFGVAFDGDGDRIGVLDEAGQVIPGDLLTALLADFLMKKAGDGEHVFYDLRSSWIVKDIIEQNNGVPHECKVGRSFIINDVRSQNALMAGELSCHFYYRDFYGVESGDLTLLYLMQMISESGKPLSALVEPLRRYYQSGEINSSVEDKQAMLELLAEKYGDGAVEVSWLDGLKVTHDDYWFNVRPSNTEPVLRLNLEARSQEKMESMRDELLAIIRK